MPRLLLVEDNELNRDLLTRRLSKRGFEIIHAADGLEAIEMATRELPDLILMDLSLPNLDGWEATERIKNQAETQSIPIIALTAHAMSGDREKAMTAGCDDYDTKPLDLPRLLGKIEKLLEAPLSASETVASAPGQSRTESPPVDEGESRGTVLVVDDIEDNRDILVRRLAKLGYESATAENGEQALAHLEGREIDLVLLDIMMPVLDGFEVLKRMKSDTALRHVPVVVISASQEMDSVVRCIEMGADDYLPKPFDSTLLQARINACVEKKRLRDQEQVFRQKLEAEKRKSDDLLNAIFPHLVVQELKATNEYRPRRHDRVAVLFCDIVNFTEYCDDHAPEAVVDHLQHLVTTFEEIAAQHEVQKIKTIGDAFMAACGLLSWVENPVRNCIQAGLGMVEAAKSSPPHWDLRVGIHLGPVVAGVVGNRQYSLDIWGDTVNTAARVEQGAAAGKVCVSETAWQQVSHLARGSSGTISARGKGDLEVVTFGEFL